MERGGMVGEKEAGVHRRLPTEDCGFHGGKPDLALKKLFGRRIKQ